MPAPNNIKPKLLFIHIPKTAGTSFRLAAQACFGTESSFFDYSPNSSETSKLIHQFTDAGQDLYILQQAFKKHNGIFLSGHIPATKFAPIFASLDTITFVRSPVDQVLSHYHHYVRFNNYQQNLEYFINEKRFQNIHTRMLAGRNLEFFGFIGITEYFSQSIRLINDYYNINLKTLRTNVSEETPEVREKIPDDLIELIKSVNSDDLKLYQKAKSIFSNRLELFNLNKPYRILILHKPGLQSIQGAAFEKDQGVALMVDILKNDQLIATVKACKYDPGLLRFSLPRKGFVGFQHRFDKPLRENDRISIRIDKQTRKNFQIKKGVFVKIPSHGKKLEKSQDFHKTNSFN